jgi:hypothetical protein
MDKRPLIVISLCAVVLLVMGSLSNVVGFQTVQSSNQNIIKERINQRELLFQTIVDIANNMDIQRIILKSQMSRGIFSTSDIPVVTKKHLKQMYILGVMLSRFISKSRIQSLIGEYHFNNQEIQQKISAVIEKDVTLRNEITQLQNPECDCENENTTGLWHFPVLCTILFSMAGITGFLSLLFGLFFDFYYIANFFYFLWEIALTIAVTVGCYYL